MDSKYAWLKAGMWFQWVLTDAHDYHEIWSDDFGLSAVNAGMVLYIVIVTSV